MSHAGRRYQDKQYRHHENHGSDRYEEDRRARTPYPYNARSTEDIRGGQHSRTSTDCLDPYSKTSEAAQEYFGPPPECYPPKETFSMKCSKGCHTCGSADYRFKRQQNHRSLPPSVSVVVKET